MAWLFIYVHQFDSTCLETFYLFCNRERDRDRGLYGERATGWTQTFTALLSITPSCRQGHCTLLSSCQPVKKPHYSQMCADKTGTQRNHGVQYDPNFQQPPSHTDFGSLFDSKTHLAAELLVFLRSCKGSQSRDKRQTDQQAKNNMM